MNIFLRQKFRQITNLSTNKWNRWKKTQKFAMFYKKCLPIMAFCGISFYFLKKKMQQKFFVNFSNSINKYLHSILTSKEIENDGVNLVNRVIAHPQTTSSLALLVKGAIKDKEISKGLLDFSNSLFVDLLQDKKIQNLIQKNLQISLQNKSLKMECINLIQYILNQEKTKEITKNYFIEMFYKNEFKKTFTNLVMESAIVTMKKNETKKKFSEFIAEVWSDSNLRWNIFKRALQFWSNSSKV